MRTTKNHQDTTDSKLYNVLTTYTFLDENVSFEIVIIPFKNFEAIFVFPVRVGSINVPALILDLLQNKISFVLLYNKYPKVKTLLLLHSLSAGPAQNPNLPRLGPRIGSLVTSPFIGKNCVPDSRDTMSDLLTIPGKYFIV